MPMLTATTASEFFQLYSSLRIRLHFNGSSSIPRARDSMLHTPFATFFNVSKSTETMLRGSGNEAAVLLCLRSLYYVHVLVEVWLFAKRNSSYLSASSHGTAGLDLARITDVCPNPSVQS